jgi:hypothetical protein
MHIEPGLVNRAKRALSCATAAQARRVIPGHMAHVDLRCGQALKLSLAYQGGLVLWVGFRVLCGRGLQGSAVVERRRHQAA